MVTKLKNIVALLLGALVMTACSGVVGLLNLTVPSDGYTVVKDIPYGPHARHKLDIYIPDTQDTQKTVLVFFYGGSWQWGDKNDYHFVGQAFAAEGYVTILADYRLYPEVSFPAFIDDAAAATVWIHNNIAKYNGNPDRIFVAGHSAGGYLAMMLAANTTYMEKAGGRTDWIKGAVGIAGPYDFLPLTDPDIIALFSTAPQEEDTQPITFVRTNMPPAFMATGVDDETVFPKNSINMAAQMQALGNDVTLRLYPGINHYTIALSMAHYFQSRSPLMQDIASFIAKH